VKPMQNGACRVQKLPAVAGFAVSSFVIRHSSFANG
jgi:hypothetical protein